MIEKLLKAMTLQEKVGQLNQRLYGWQIFEKTANQITFTDYFKQEVERFAGLGFIYGVFRADPWSTRNVQTGLANEIAAEFSSKIQRYLKENTRLGIPALLTEECPHGHQGLNATTLPVNYTVGASWNTQLYEKAQAMVAEELRSVGAHIGLISTLDVARDARWGRTEECFSEDAYLTGQFTKAALRGLQANDTPHKVIATLKHFAAQGATIGGHNAGPTGIGQRELQEIHLLPMLYAIDEHAKLIMAAYNDIDGIPCHGNEWLLQNILRQQMNYQGLVMADGVALERLVPLVNGDRALAAAWALNSGVNISLWDNVFPYLEEAVAKNYLSMERIDHSVRQVLQLKEEAGLFAPAQSFVPVFQKHEKQVLNKQLAQESIVLLKNDEQQVPLSLAKLKKIAVIGPNAHAPYNQLGDYTPFKNVANISTIYDGIKEYVGHQAQVTYAQGCGIVTSDEQLLAKALNLASESDVVILCLGGASTRDFSTKFDSNGAALSGAAMMTSGENIDLANIEIPLAQQLLVEKIQAVNKNIVIALIQGRPHVISKIEQHAKAIFNLGYPGERGGEAFAEILFGKVSPSGKLAMSIADSNGSLPVYYNYKDNHHKYTYQDQPTWCQYPFGYGLSYTTFELSNILIEPNITEQVVSIRGNITNVGDMDAQEVVKVYIQANHQKVIPRVRELKGFTKMLVKSGETVAFEVQLGQRELSGLDVYLNKRLYDTLTVIVEGTNSQFTTSVRVEL